MFLFIEELIFLFFTTKNLSYMGIVLLFSLLTTLLFSFLVSFIKEKYQKLVSMIVVCFITIIYIANYLGYQIFGSILSFSTVKQGTQAFQFINLLIEKIIQNWYVLLLFLIPLIIILVLINKRKITFKKHTKFYLIGIPCLYLIIMGFIFFDNKKLNSKKNLYFYIHEPTQNLNVFGLFTTLRLNIQRNFFGFKEKQFYIYSNGHEEEILDMEKYNMLDIPFDNINKTEEIKEISEYLKSQKPTSKNEYTGIFEGKNLIIVLAESLSDIAIKEEITPTLYKLYKEGLSFTNYYSPLYPKSTADGEYIIDSSLLPITGSYSINLSTYNAMPYNYGTVFKDQEYYLSAYHNFIYNYYGRDEYFKQLNYDHFEGCGNGLEKKINCNLNPTSDYEMIKNTIDDYVNQEHFMTYYVTMSGHVNYDMDQDMIKKNYNLVKDLPYSEKGKYYLAAQIELDKALEELISRLEKANQLEDTVIMIVGDHYPYGLELSDINSLSSYERDGTFDKTKVPFIIYNSKTEGKRIDKYCSNLDVLPTILNLFNISYDSRLLMGKDAFSKEEAPVIFYNHSFITTSGRYNAITEEITGNISKEELEKFKTDIYLKFKISRLILENNYYQYIVN